MSDIGSTTLSNIISVCSSWNDQQITRFVREELGCGCPDEVFEQIERKQLSDIGGTDQSFRLLIGERLLIYLLQPMETTLLGQSIETWIATGREDRDANGYNRFRLVVVMPDGTEAARITELEKLFVTFAADDEKLHLHLLEQSEIHSINREV